MPNADGTDKFMVVIAVISVLFIGITGYLISLDIKLRKQEQN